MKKDTAKAWVLKHFDYEFVAVDYLARALTHRSAAANNNERLEFLGDAVLDSVISEAVYRLQPAGSEGELSRLRSALVKDSSLAEIATELQLGELLVLGAGEKKAGGHRRASILADALEALFGAVYLDAGYDTASRVIHKVFGTRLSDLPDPAELRDPKTRLQEFLQARKMSLPAYEVADISGKAHKQTFDVTCTIDDPPLTASGTGSSRRDAEQRAADEMMTKLQQAAS